MGKFAVVLTVFIVPVQSDLSKVFVIVPSVKVIVLLFTLIELLNVVTGGGRNS